MDNKPILIQPKPRRVGYSFPVQKPVMGIERSNGEREYFDEPMYMIDFQIKYNN